MTHIGRMDLVLYVFFVFWAITATFTVLAIANRATGVSVSDFFSIRFAFFKDELFSEKGLEYRRNALIFAVVGGVWMVFGPFLFR